MKSEAKATNVKGRWPPPPVPKQGSTSAGSAERASSEWWFGRAHEIFSVAAVTMNQLQLERAELLTARMMRSVEARAVAKGGGGGRAQLALLRARMLSNSSV